MVTGGAGFLGSWLTKMLVGEGAEVVVLARDHAPKSLLFLSGTFSQVTVVRGAVEDYSVLERTLAEYEIDTVFHLAAQAIAPIANKNPISTFETNIKGTWNVLEAARRSPLVKRVIVASSDKAYGDQKVLPYTEKTPLLGLHPYDVSKSCADLIANAYYVSYHLPVCITRCVNLYGGGDLNFSRLIPSVIRSALFGESPVLRSDGRHIRDFIYVEDAARAMLMLAEAMDDAKVVGNAFNFGNERGISVLQMARLILKRMKASVPLTILNQASNEIPVQYLSAQKARKMLGWKPQYRMEEAIDKTIAWYKDFFSGQLSRKEGRKKKNGKGPG